MGYAALLFCPDDKTARTVTHVLSELEFAVEACAEPFAAVKKLMGQHFDAVVVDCDNEQNATLVFKSARNSTSNQTSLAVAVVEGQAGVAKAFRIGANLVLTKPINIEQAKGTLRVARGLLRKGEPLKPVTPAPSSAVPAKPAPPKATAELKISEPVSTASPLAPEPSMVPWGPPPTPSPAVVATSRAVVHDDDLLGIEGDESQTATPSKPAAVIQPKSSFTADAQSNRSSGAASAPAPARERAAWELFEKPPASTSAPAVPSETPADTQPHAAAVIGAAPTFTFGGADEETESAGGGKKLFIGIAAVLLVAAALYFGWAHSHTSAGQPAAENVSPVSSPATSHQPLVKPAEPQPPSAKPSAMTESKSSAANELKSRAAENSDRDEAADESTDSTKLSPEEKPEAAPLVIKGGKNESHTKPGSPDAAPPSVIGLAAPGDAAPPANLIPNTTPSLRPSLQTLNVSQGVSQGLLIKKVAPVYPGNALRMRIEGTVELVATISKTGEITHVKIVSGDAQLTKAAAEAVKQWKYKPYLLNGEPVEIQTQVTVNFKLPH